MKPFAARYKGNCVFNCGKGIERGEPIVWNRSVKGQVGHHSCYMAAGEAFPATPTPHVAVAAPAPVIAGGDSLAATIAAHVTPAVIDAIMPKIVELVPDNLDADKVRAIVKDMMIPKRVEIVTPQAPDKPIDAGLQHKNFPLLVQAASAREKGKPLNIALVGQAGSGKTTALLALAKVLDRHIGITNAFSDPMVTLWGYKSPVTGEYVRTAFRDCWERPSMFIADDFDRNTPDIGAAMLTPLSTNVCGFPDTTLEKHSDCTIAICMNTWGYGGSSEYVGGFKQDAAFLDRFVKIPWDIDEDLERATCSNDKWVSRVQEVRHRVVEKGIKVLVTPRATYQGEALLAGGVAWGEVETLTIKGGMTVEQWKSVK